ncbi:MAG: ATP-binding protein [Immundisolibacter sp.]|uniref:ATP-binding protein n=1 Tax=Immundisolibacter sp. TaxID=1934948 RepID=UPI003D0C9F5A
MNDDLTRLVRRAEALLDRVDALLPPPPRAIDWQTTLAARWQARPGGRRALVAVEHPQRLDLDDLQGIDRVKTALDRNTRQFLAGAPANDALLWGSRGTGKSSLVKALLTRHAAQGLRLIEVDKDRLVDLPDIAAATAGLPHRFIVFCDDLSFGSDEPAYKALKVALDGSVSGGRERLLIYATSNRRHLLPEYQEENALTRHVGEEIHFAEAVEEKIALSERFGLWLAFHAFDQERYLSITQHWLARLGCERPVDDWREEALRWALTRGSRSGRAAYQFARDYAGRLALGETP